MHFHFHCDGLNATPAALIQILAGIQELKELSMSGKDEVLRAIAEDKAQNEQIIAALSQLVGVVTPLLEQLNSVKETLAAAQTELAALQSSNAELDASLTQAAADLDAGQETLSGKKLLPKGYEL